MIDDSNWFAKTSENMTEMVGKCTEFLTFHELKFNKNKCDRDEGDEYAKWKLPKWPNGEDIQPKMNAFAGVIASDVDQADDTVRSLTVLDLEDCDRITNALAVERVQWEQCVRELGEKPFANYLRITNFKRNLLQRFGEVVVEFDFIIAHRSELNLARIKDWKDAEKLFVEAAVVAARNSHQDSGYDASKSDAGSGSSGDNRHERRHGRG